MTLRSRMLGLAFALALGEGAGLKLGAFGAAWPVALAACILTLSLGAGFSLRGWGYAATALLGLALALSSECARAAVLEESVRTNGAFACELTVASPPNVRTGRDGRRWVSFPGAADGVRFLAVVQLAEAEELPREGERWRVSGWLERRPFFERTRRRLWVTGRGTSAERVAPAPGWRRALIGVRESFSRRLGIGLEADSTAAELSRAILLGERRRLDPGLKRRFEAAGALHLFAISGLHVGVIGMLLVLLSRVLFLPYRFVALPVVPILWAYVLMIGAPPSAVRAGAMATIVVAAPLCWRKADGVAAWALVFLATHLMKPALIGEVGSLLSFAVMLAILVWSEAVGRGVLFAAWGAGVPVVAHVFGTFTLGGLVSNLVLIPAAVGVVVAGVAGILVSFASSALAAYVNHLSALFIGGMAAVAGAVASLPGAHFEVMKWPLSTCALWYLALALVIWLLARLRLRRERMV